MDHEPGQRRRVCKEHFFAHAETELVLERARELRQRQRVETEILERGGEQCTRSLPAPPTHNLAGPGGWVLTLRGKREVKRWQNFSGLQFTRI